MSADVAGRAAAEPADRSMANAPRREQMSAPQRLFLMSLVLAAAAAEAVYALLRGPEACVIVANQGAEPIEAVRLACGRGVVELGRIAPGESARVHLRGHAKGLSLAFHQRGNPMTGCDAPDFDPAALGRDDSALVLEVRPGEVERHLDDDPTVNWATRLRRFTWNWLTSGSH